MQEERNHQETFDLNLVDLFWSILRHWKSILVTMIILGILLMGYGAFREYQQMTDKNFVKEQQEAYESAIEAYELRKEQLENKLENLEEDLDRQQFYEENAIMLNFDQYNVYIKTASYYINTGYEIAPELYFQNPNYTGVITNSYKAAIDRINLDDAISSEDNPNLTTRNPINGPKKMLYTSTDSGNGVLSITILGDTYERVQQIYTVVKKVISEQERLLGTIIGEHTVGVLSEKDYTDIDTEFGSLQEAFDDKTESITKGIEETKQALDDLTEPVNETPTKASVIKQGIKYGIIGVIIGFLLLGGFFLISIILQDKIYSVEDILRRYSLPVLGVYCPDTKKQWKIDKFISQKLGISVSKTKENQLQFIASSIHFYLKDSKRILLIGNSEIEILEMLTEQLAPLVADIEVSVGGNVNDSNLALDALSEKTAVICIENWAKTAHRAIRRELKTVEDSGNKNLGFILIG